VSSPRSLASTAVAALLLVVLAAAPAAATFHFMCVVEVYGGDDLAPDAQYVVLQMYSAGQTLVAGHSVAFYDEDGLLLDSATFAENVGNGADQAKILIATPSAEALFGITADLRMPAALATSGGKVCFVGVDCVAWGGYNPADAAVGTPFQGATGLEEGDAAIRRLDVCQTAGCNDAELDAADDTNDSANDFFAGAPAPRNNGGAIGSFDAQAIFLHGFEDAATGGWSAAVSP